MSQSSRLIDALIRQRDSIRDWIEEAPFDASIDQLHLITNSSECAYWHHGYQAALDDVIQKIIAIGSEDYTSGRSN